MNVEDKGKRVAGEEKRVNNFYSEISWRTFLPRLILFVAFFSLSLFQRSFRKII